MNGLDLTSFDTTNGLPSELKSLNFYANDLTSFDATNLPKNLEILSISSNELTSFDATHLPDSLTTLYLQYNDLTSFDATHLPRYLHRLKLNDNPKLTSFTLADIPKNLDPSDVDLPWGLTREKRSEIFNKLRDNYKKYNDD